MKIHLDTHASWQISISTLASDSRSKAFLTRHEPNLTMPPCLKYEHHRQEFSSGKKIYEFTWSECSRHQNDFRYFFHELDISQLSKLCHDILLRLSSCGVDFVQKYDIKTKSSIFLGSLIHSTRLKTYSVFLSKFKN